MLIKVLGAADIIGGIILMLTGVITPNVSFLVILGAIFIIKSSIGRLRDFGSWIDLSSGIFFLVSVFFQIEIINIILGIFLIQKGLASLM